MIGKTISHYKILEKLGEGGMGVVYKARDIKLDRDVALKFLPANLTASSEEVSRFEQEAIAISALNHPNIETIYDVDEAKGQKYLVLEYIPGGTLKSKLKQLKSEDKSFSIAEVVDYGIQLAEGLGHAHGQEIIHRDVKTDNILLTKEGKIKLTDFGLAKLKGTVQKTKTGSTLGTAAYMSTEQVRGEEVDSRSDIFSFGVVLYELVTSHLPFQGDYEAALSYSILNDNPPSVKSVRPEVPQVFEKIINRCLEKDKTKRYQHAEEIVSDLRTVQQEISPSIKAKKKAIKLPLFVGGVVGTLALIVLIYLLLLPKSATRNEKSIAVLPFQNLSSEGPYAYFAGGLHDELLTQLSKVAALTVISRTSVMSYAGTSKTLKQIASELGVGSVVEGSVQVAGERLRVNVQLIDAAKDAHIWAERYDRTLDDAFTIQSDVAQQIVAAVGAVLTNTEHQGMVEAPTGNAEAYRLYLQGKDYSARVGRNQQDIEIAQQLFERALALDPKFALAHTALSIVHGVMYWYRYDSSPKRVELQREEAKAALRIAPDLPEAHLAMGFSHYYGHRDYQRALEEFAIALERLPNNADIWADIGYVHRRLGHWEEVLKAFEKATQLDPRAAELFFDLGGSTYQVMHRHAEAVRAYDQALSLVPDFHMAAIYKGWTYVLWQGQSDSLRAALGRLPRDAYLGRFGTREALYVQLLYFERHADSLLQYLGRMHITVFDSQDFFLPSSIYTSWTHRQKGDHLAASSAIHSALALLDSVLRELPDDWRVHAARGLALAIMDRRDEALSEASWLEKSEVYREDAMQGPCLAEFRAQILAQVGEVSAALQEIQKLLAAPSRLSVPMLQLDPKWDPIRDHPRFQALLKKYAINQ